MWRDAMWGALAGLAGLLAAGGPALCIWAALARRQPRRNRSSMASKEYALLLLQLAATGGATIGLLSGSRTLPLVGTPLFLILVTLLLRRLERRQGQARVVTIPAGEGEAGAGPAPRRAGVAVEGWAVVGADVDTILALFDDHDRLSRVEPGLAGATFCEPAPDQRVARFDAGNGTCIWTLTCLPGATGTRVVLQCEFAPGVGQGVTGGRRLRRAATTTVQSFLRRIERAFADTPAPQSSGSYPRLGASQRSAS